MKQLFFEMYEMPQCCGVGVIGQLYVQEVPDSIGHKPPPWVDRPITQEEADTVAENILDNAEDEKWRTLLATTAGQPLVDEFLKLMGWEVISEFRSWSTGNTVRVWKKTYDHELPSTEDDDYENNF